MRKILLFIGVFAVIAIGLGVLLHPILGFFLALVIVVGGPLGYARFAGRGRTPSKGLYWRGYMSFMEPALVEKELFPDIHYHACWRLGQERADFG